jgi:heterotetrameric sarcosine oxidase gamma subunit
MVELASISILPAASIASLAARNGCGDALRAIATREFGIDLPNAPCHVAANDLSFLWMGPDQWLVLSTADNPDFESSLRHLVDDVACVTDQSDGRTIMRISGARAHEAMAKLVPIDLHPQTFAADATALTLAGHIPVQIWRTGDGGFDIACFRSYAGSLSKALHQAAAGI